MCYQGVWFVGKAATGPWEVAQSVPEEIYKIPAELARAPRHLRHGRRGQRRRVGDVRGGRRLHRHDGRVGLRGVGHRLVLPAVLRATAATIRTTTRTSRPTATRPGTTRGPAPTDAASASTGRTAAPASARATTRAPAPTRAARRPMARTARAASAQAYNPRTGTYGQTRQGSNVYGSWGSTAVQRGDDWAKTNRYTNSQTGNTTRTIRTDEGAAVTRRGDNGGAVGGRTAAATSTPATTATSIAARTAPGRSTTTAAGPTRRTSRPTGPGRPIAPLPIVRKRRAVRPVHRIVRRPTSSIETRAPAPKARSARATPATIGRARAAARVLAVTAAVAAPAVEAGGGGGDCAAWPASRLRAAAHAPGRIIRAGAGDACGRHRGGAGAEGGRHRGRTGGRERPAHARPSRRTTRHASPRLRPSRRGRRPNRSPMCRQAQSAGPPQLHHDFLTDPSGLYPFFGSVYSGGGFTLGAGYRQFYGDRTHWDLKGLYSLKNYKLFELSTDSWKHSGGLFDLHARVGWRDATQVAYYGLGMTTPNDNANFRLKQTYVGGDMQVRPARIARLGAGVDLRRLRPRIRQRRRALDRRDLHAGDRARTRRQSEVRTRVDSRVASTGGRPRVRAPRRTLRSHVPRLPRRQRDIQLRPRRWRDRAAPANPRRDMGRVAARRRADHAARRRRRARTS